MPFRRTGPNWATAKHPGYKNEKDQARGGTRREVAAEAAKDKVTRKPTTKKALTKDRAAAPQKESKAQRKVRERREGKK